MFLAIKYVSLNNEQCMIRPTLDAVEFRAVSFKGNVFEFSVDYNANNKSVKYKFSKVKCYSSQKWNNDKCQCQCKKYRVC